MKTPHYLVRLFLTAALVLFCGSAFAQVESRDRIKSGTISFTPGTCRLTTSATTALDTLAGQMSDNPSFKVVVMGNSGGSKPLQQMSWLRIRNVIDYMGDAHNIDRRRFIFQLQGTATNDNVDFRVAREGEDGPATTNEPAPGFSCP